jgi:YVTN family beta-propeller protein
MKPFMSIVFSLIAALTLAAQERPGFLNPGTILLPNRWQLSPAGKNIGLGDFPLNMAMSPDGRYLAINHNGHSRQFVAIIDLQTEKKVSEATVDKSFYGITFSRNGQMLFVSGAADNLVYQYDFSRGYLSNERKIAVDKPAAKTYPAGIAVSDDGKYLYTADNLSNTVSVVSLASANVTKRISLGTDSYPYTVLPARDGKSLYVSFWGKSSVGVVDMQTSRLMNTIPTGDHPNALLLSPDGKILYVANANSNTVTLIDTASNKPLCEASTALHPNSLEGSTPNALAISKDGKTLLVANADNNDLAVVDTSDPRNARVKGFIPVGWYPTAVHFSADEKKIYAINGKGTISFANPQGESPFRRRDDSTEYIGRLMQGSLSVITTPDKPTLDKYTAQVYKNSPYQPENAVTMTPDRGNPLPAAVGGTSPIKHVIYIIKENRTYDQILGDIKEGNGDPRLCLFPESITPNHHSLVREFTLLDNFYADAEVSADGHNWSMGAYATDYVEKLWPQNYSNRGRAYDYEGQSKISAPSAGYIWDQAAKAGITYRSYGEFVENAKVAGKPGEARVPALAGHIDPLYRSFDLNYKDVDRAKRYIEELQGFQRKGEMPQLTVLRLPNDHTDGTRPKMPTPTAMVADNDLALGMIVEEISKSIFWKDTAIFVVEDDAQNGSDHVDAHRTVALVISPYTKRHAVDNTMYSSVSILRSIELILGLKPMSQFDAAALPMYNSFTAEANTAPYTHKIPQTKLDDMNTATAYGAFRSLAMNLNKEDAIPEAEFNEIIWKAIRGADSPMPPPVHAAFVKPFAKRDHDDR